METEEPNVPAPKLQVLPKEEPAKTPPAPTAPAPRGPETPAEAHARAQRCNADVQRVCAAYRCRLVPTLTTDPVGNGPGARLLVAPSLVVMPDPID